MKFQAGQLVVNNLSNGQAILCRVIEFVESVGMFRLTDARETQSNSWLIANDKTWAAPLGNIEEIEHEIALAILEEQKRFAFVRAN